MRNMEKLQEKSPFMAGLCGRFFGGKPKRILEPDLLSHLWLTITDFDIEFRKHSSPV